MDSAAIIKRLLRDGWTIRNVRGSHHDFTHPTRPGIVEESRADYGVTVPDLPPGCMLAVVDIDLNKLALSGKTVRLNVSIPERTVALIDRAAKRAGTSRSNFLTQAAVAFIERESRIA